MVERDVPSRHGCADVVFLAMLSRSALYSKIVMAEDVGVKTVHRMADRDAATITTLRLALVRWHPVRWLERAVCQLLVCLQC